MRRLMSVLVLTFVALQPPSSRADVPAELLQDPGAATPVVAAAATPADIVGEAASVLLPKKDAEKLTKVSVADRATALNEFWSLLAPHEKATLQYASAKFREGGKFVNDRSVALIALTAPVKIYDEASRDWTGSSAPVLTTPAELKSLLKALPNAPAPAPTMAPLSGAMPTQAWIYPGATVNEQRVVWFVDDGADGTWRFVKDERSVPVTTVVSSGAAEEMPAELFPAAGAGQKVEPLPTLTQDVLPIQISADSFKASAGRTFMRLMPLLDPSDVDLELSLDPATYKGGATLWIQVEKDGVVVHQAKVALSTLPAAEQWLAEFGVPLSPGAHRVTALVTDKDGKGGKKSMDIDVPGFAGAVALSSAVLSKAAASAGEAGLPKAVAMADGSLSPFQIGNYTVRPQVPPVFKRGDVIAVVVQVYGSAKATVEYDLWREGSYQNSTDPTQLDTLPVTDIQQFTISPEYTDGTYEFRVTAKAGGTEATRKVSFRIKG